MIRKVIPQLKTAQGLAVVRFRVNLWNAEACTGQTVRRRRQKDDALASRHLLDGVRETENALPGKEVVNRLPLPGWEFWPFEIRAAVSDRGEWEKAAAQVINCTDGFLHGMWCPNPRHGKILPCLRNTSGCWPSVRPASRPSGRTHCATCSRLAAKPSLHIDRATFAPRDI